MARFDSEVTVAVHWQNCIHSGCGVPFGVTIEFDQARRRDGKPFYCPNGHYMAFTETEADKIRRERDRLKQANARLQQEANDEANARLAADRRASAAKGRITRLKNRVAAGLCPCCNRSFENLGRHMTTQHPAFRAQEA